jgi:hypothetical protein
VRLDVAAFDPNGTADYEQEQLRGASRQAAPPVHAGNEGQ